MLTAATTDPGRTPMLTRIYLTNEIEYWSAVVVDLWFQLLGE